MSDAPKPSYFETTDRRFTQASRKQLPVLAITAILFIVLGFGTDVLKTYDEPEFLPAVGLIVICFGLAKVIEWAVGSIKARR